MNITTGWCYNDNWFSTLCASLISRNYYTY